MLIHPQSIVHSLVEYADGSVIAQLSSSRHACADRARLPIPGAWNRAPSPSISLRYEICLLKKPDAARFPCLALAYSVLRAGGAAPAVLNAANEIAVEAFLAGRLAFTGIAGVIADTLAALPAGPADELAQVMEADAHEEFARMRILARAA